MSLNPADVEHVWRLLKSVLSHNAEERTAAERGLEDLSSHASFCACLLEVLKHPDVEDATKWLAVVQLKNIVTRRWAQPRVREAAGASLLGEAEKEHVRAAILDMVGLKDNKLALQVAVIIAKIARHDYPASWPALFDRLTAPVVRGDSDELVARRAWLTLHHVLKELASKRLMADQRRFHDITAGLMQTVCATWAADAHVITAHLPAALAGGDGGAPAPNLGAQFETWMLVTKVLRRLLMHGVPKDNQTLEPHAWVCQVLPATVHMQQVLLQHRLPAPSPAQRVAVMLESSVLKVAKVHCMLVQVHPWAYEATGALLTSMELYCGVVRDTGRRGLSWGKIVSRAMRFLSLVYQSPEYNHKEQLVHLRAQERSEDAVAELWRQKCAALKLQLAAFWHANGRRQHLVECLVNVHLPIRPAELDDWQADPETWYHVNEGILSEDDSRGITEILLREIVQSDAAQLAPMLANAVQVARDLVTAPALAAPALDQAALDALARKEAIYCAACTLAYELYDHIDFSEWLQASLLPELSVNVPHNRALQRRCMRCIAEWISSTKKAARPGVYGALVRVLQTAHDVCLQLVAVDTLRVMVEDWDFDEEQLAPFLQPVLSQMPALLQATESFDSHALVFTLVSAIVERMGDLVRPHAPAIMAWLPAVWQHSAGQGLLRMQVLTLLQRLVNALGAASPATYPLVLPVLDYALDVGGPEALNLLEDALLLWLVTLRNAPTGTLEALPMWPRWVAVSTASIEHVPVCMQIATSCILLGGVQFLQAHGAQLAEVLTHVIGDLKSAAMVALYVPMLHVVQMFAEDGVRLLRQPLIKLLHVLLSGEEEVQSWAKGVTVFARCLLHCPAATLALFDDACRQGVRLVAPGGSFAGTPPAASGATLLLAFLADWMDRFDCVAQPGDRKLCAMAVAAVLPMPVPGLFGHFDAIACCMTSVWLQLEGGGDDAVPYGFDIFVGMSEAPDDVAGLSLAAATMSEDAEGETHRKSGLADADPVRTAKLSWWVKERVQQAHQVRGAALTTAVATLPSEVSAQLQTMVR